VVWGVAPGLLLAKSGVDPDFTSNVPLAHHHREMKETRVYGDPNPRGTGHRGIAAEILFADVYFVANPLPHSVEAPCRFRAAGSPELWWPDTGRIEPAAIYQTSDKTTKVACGLRPTARCSSFFRAAKAHDAVTSIAHNGKIDSPVDRCVAEVAIRRAVYGVLSDPQRTKDVRGMVQQFLDRGERSFAVSAMAQGGDSGP